MSSLCIIFVYQGSQGSLKIELKTQLPLVLKKQQQKTKNKKETKKKQQQKNHALNFEDIENLHCANSSFINSLHNAQS